ncbi:MAG: UvrD-helicase domain-containing protein [Flavobacteriales bacterium]|nr:UvrD-helicase domain-containing protein [Flavobacteriales bacterium]
MLRVLHSSAGAGKTHALVKRYLTLCLTSEAPYSYRQVLALTFTNKAASEMRDRVLEYLADMREAHLGDLRIKDIFDDLTEHHDMSVPLIQERAGKVLAHMLHHYSDVSITTIDAFIRRAVIPFARDLGLDQDLRMTTEEDHYQEQALDRLLSMASPGTALTRILVANCEALVDDEKRWDPRVPFADLSKELGREQAAAHVAELKGLDDRLFVELDRRLRAEIAITRQRVQQLGKDLLDAFDRSGIDASDLSHGRNGPYGYFKRMAEFRDQLAPFGANVRKALEQDKWVSGSADEVRAEKIMALRPQMIDTLEQVRSMEEDGTLRDHAIRVALCKELMPLAAMHVLEEQLEKAKQEDGVTFFQDLTRSVARVVEREPVPFIYERLGQRYRHFLFDEFQDTSLLQWSALLPLVENALSEGGEVLLVGDAKQAIYRWRNGEVRQFINLPRIHGKERMADGDRRERALMEAFVQEEGLDTNYRSAASVVGFNNTFFGSLREKLPDGVKKIFDNASQQCARSLTGSVTIRMIPARLEAQERRQRENELVLQAIHESLEDGYAYSDIAILVRSKDRSRQIAKALRPAGIPVLSRDALVLEGDAGVECIVSLLRFMHDPSDRNACLAHQWLHQVAPDRHASAVTHRNDVGPGYAERTRELRDMLPGDRASLTELALALIRLVFPEGTEMAFLNVFLTDLHQHVRDHGHAIPLFLEQWDRTIKRKAVTLPAGMEAISLMTIHASKGLQFPVVIVPFPEMVAKPKQGERLWIAPGELMPEVPHALVPWNKLVIDQGIPEAKDELELQAMDAADLLYVAMTRPEDRLYIHCPAGSKDPYVDILLSLVVADGTTTEERTWGERTPKTTSKPPTDRTHTLIQGPIGRGARPATRSTVPETWDPMDPDPMRRAGDVVHALLADVGVIGDLAEAVHRRVLGGELNELEGRQLMDRLEPLLAREDIGRFFRSGTRSWRETGLIRSDGSTLRPDRVVHADGSWQVLEIKTGARRDEHLEQLNSYRSELEGILGRPVSGALLYVATGELIEA